MTEMRILKLLLPTTGNMKEEEQWKQNFKNLFSFFLKKIYDQKYFLNKIYERQAKIIVL